MYRDARIPAQKFTFIHKRPTIRWSHLTRLSPSETYPYQTVDII